MRLRARLEVELFSPGEARRVATAGVRPWAGLPLRIQGSDELYDQPLGYGCRVGGERAFLPTAGRDKVLDRIAHEKQAWQDSHGDGPPPWPGWDIEVFTRGQALLAYDVR